MREFSGPSREFRLDSATLAEPLPLRLTLLEGQPAGRLWDYHLRGDGDLLVFNDGSRLVRIGTGSEKCQQRTSFTRSICATVRRGAHATPVDSVFGQLIAIREPRAVAVVGEQGNVVRVFPFEPADVRVARLDGGRLVVARSKGIETYDVATGARELSRPLPTYRLADVDGGIAVLLRAETVMLLRLGDGRSPLALAPGGGRIFADLEPPGLYYSYAAGNGGRLVLVPRADLLRQLG